MKKRRLPSLDALRFITNVKPAPGGIRVNHRDLDRVARDLVARDLEGKGADGDWCVGV
jgi:hypothetical protein